jgi:predicted DNA binding protein
MTLFEVVLKLTHDSPFIDLTRRFPSVKIFSWCNNQNDIIEIVVENPDEYSLVMEQIPEIEWIIEESSDRTRIHLIVHKCSCTAQNSVDVLIGDLNLLHVFPEVMEKGWEFHRIIAFRHEDLEDLLQRMEEGGWVFEILRKVPFDGFIASSLMLTADALFSDLTQKQVNAVLTAHRHGYYMRPRKADVQTIAAKKQISRTTFQEHLKKAENKLVTALVPYMQLYNHTPAEKRERLKIK